MYLLYRIIIICSIHYNMKIDVEVEVQRHRRLRHHLQAYKAGVPLHLQLVSSGRQNTHGTELSAGSECQNQQGEAENVGWDGGGIHIDARCNALAPVGPLAPDCRYTLWYSE